MGEVVTSFTKEISGKLRTIAVACMEKADALVYDVCSIEAEVNEDNGTVWDVSNITGIAVSNSSIDQPAFSSAKRMTMVQCFGNDQGGPDPSRKDIKMPVTLEDLASTPIDLLRQAVSMRNMHPSQLFELRDLEDDKEFGQIVKDKTTAEAKVIELTGDLSKSQEKFAKVEKQNNSSTAQKLFDTALEKRVSEKKITDKQKLYLSENFDAESFETADEAAIEGYFTKGTEDYQKVAKIFGDTGSGDTGNGDDGGSGGPSEKSMEDAFNEE